MSESQTTQITDFIINLMNKLSYTGGGITLGSLVTYKEELSIIFAALALVFTGLTFFISLYFQLKRNKREELESRHKNVVFEQEQEERRLHLKKDTGDRRREDD